jgi:5,10-methylenetetrahydrofolate reductase
MADFQKDAVREAFREQISALVGAGVDLLLLETFHHLGEMQLALEESKKLFAGPIVAQMSFEDDARLRDGTSPERCAAILTAHGADVVGVNCCAGPSVVFDVAVEMLKGAPLVAAQPNAGLPRVVDARTIYMATPEYLGVFAKRYYKAGVRLVGGCCGTRPEHVAAMAAAARMMGNSPAAKTGEHRLDAVPRDPKGLEPVPAAERSRLAHKVRAVWETRLNSGAAKARPAGRSDFVVSVEVNPVPGLDCAKPLETARTLFAGGVDVVNIADGPRAVVRMSNMALGAKMMEKLGAEVILHVCCRDRNLLGLQADLLGAHVFGFRNLVVITGDPPKMGDYPKATAVFDLDSIGLLQLVDNLNRGIDPAGKMVGERTSFFAACGAEPGALDFDREMRRLRRKIESGAEMIMTQPVYDRAVIRRFLDAAKPLGVPVLLGLCPLVSSRNAEFLHHEVPGMAVPDAIRERMRKATPGPESVKVGVAVAQETLLEFMDEVVGVYLMPQLGKYASALDVLAPLGYGPA